MSDVPVEPTDVEALGALRARAEALSEALAEAGAIKSGLQQIDATRAAVVAAEHADRAVERQVLAREEIESLANATGRLLFEEQVRRAPDSRRYVEGARPAPSSFVFPVQGGGVLDRPMLMSTGCVVLLLIVAGLGAIPKIVGPVLIVALTWVASRSAYRNRGASTERYGDTVVLLPDGIARTTDGFLSRVGGEGWFPLMQPLADVAHGEYRLPLYWTLAINERGEAVLVIEQAEVVPGATRPWYLAALSGAARAGVSIDLTQAAALLRRWVDVAVNRATADVQAVRLRLEAEGGLT